MTSQILFCLVPQTLPWPYASLGVRNVPLKRLELKAVVCYNSVSVLLFMCPNFFFQNVPVKNKRKHRSVFLISLMFSSVFCLLIGKKLNSQKMNEFTSPKTVYLRSADLSLWKEKHGLILSLDFIIDSFVFCLSLKTVKSSEVFLVVTNTHLENVFLIRQEMAYWYCNWFCKVDIPGLSLED